MGSYKLQSFQDFAKSNTVTRALQLKEEQSAARTKAADKFKTLLSDFDVTSIKELKEEDRKSFFSKLATSEISESISIIEEGTRSQIGKIKKNGKITSVYMHYDGYPDNMLPKIKKGYADGKAVDLLLKKGGGSGLEVKVDDINFYGDKATLDGDMKDTEKFVKDAANNGGAEFIYLYSETDKKWYMVDVYDSYDLVPAFESLNNMIINEKFVVSKGNLRDAKKVAKWLESFFTNHTALMDGPLMLGVCKYLLAESLTDANFHRYRDPVSKKIGGAITTITVEIDKLGGQQIPVSKKSIMNLLDEHYSGLANAAGWSGIGIVEGMALFLDGFGYSKIAEAITAEFNLIWANESAVTEGNAFLAARAKAIEEDAEEFEFNGKNFPVIKENESVVNESEAENILQDLLDERGGDMGELHGMEMEDALDTVESYGHKGSKAKKIAQELVSMCNESAVTEGKSFSEREIKATAEVVADAIAKVYKTKAKVIDFETLDKDGKIAGFYIYKATNDRHSRYWVTDSGEVVSAFRHDTFGDGVVAQVGDKLASVVKTFKANESAEIEITEEESN